MPRARSKRISPRIQTILERERRAHEEAARRAAEDVLNQGHLRLVLEGKKAVQDWRRWNPNGRLLLRGAELGGFDLQDADLHGANLHGADLTDANLKNADLSGASLFKADFDRADLSHARLVDSDLSEADLSWAEASYADFTGADMTWTRFWETNLKGANLTGARVFVTLFGDTDLSETLGLDTLAHIGPSVVDERTLLKSGKLPLPFLRGCGIPDALLDYLPTLMDADPIQFYSCFISYSNEDQDFAERLHADLQDNGVRCWFAPEDMHIGDPIRVAIDQAIRVYDKLLLILSESSVRSDWVQSEVERAFEKERKKHRIVLVPIRLDNAVMETDVAWAADVRQRHIGDFRKWEKTKSYKQALKALLRDLKST